MRLLNRSIETEFLLCENRKVVLCLWFALPKMSTDRSTHFETERQLTAAMQTNIAGLATEPQMSSSCLSTHQLLPTAISALLPNTTVHNQTVLISFHKIL
jgi:hypothetical protein